MFVLINRFIFQTGLIDLWAFSKKKSGQLLEYSLEIIRLRSKVMLKFEIPKNWLLKI